MKRTPEQLFSALKFPALGNRAVLVRSIDGAWWDNAGSSRGISNQTDLDWLVANRAASDAVVVSAKTAIAENYKSIKHRTEYQILRTHTGLELSAKLITITSNPTRIEPALEISDYVVTKLDYAHPKVISLASANESFISQLIKELRQRGLIRLVFEGGPTLIESLISAGELNQLALTTTNSSGAIQQFPKLTAYIESNPILFEESEDGTTFQLFGKLPEWQDLLPNHNFAILRKAYTEPAFSVNYEKTPSEGFYTCRACGNRLFEATTQFDARCGWPAFWEPSADSKVKLIEDSSHGMRRVEVVCAACDSHLGHVFYGEGFGFPTDARYCINAGALERN